MEKLAREQKSLSRKKVGSKNFQKQRLKVAEDLAVKKMMRNRNFAKGIASASWSKFLKMLEYKAESYGDKHIKVPTTYPSSQLCSCCGFQNPAVKDPRIRKWECPKCSAIHNRDENAAINILRKGKEMLEKA